jgi:hypothetical protein
MFPKHVLQLPIRILAVIQQLLLLSLLKRTPAGISFTLKEVTDARVTRMTRAETNH